MLDKEREEKRENEKRTEWCTENRVPRVGIEHRGTGHRTEERELDRGQRIKNRGQRTKDRGLSTESREQRTENRIEDREQNRGQRTKERGQKTG